MKTRPITWAQAKRFKENLIGFIQRTINSQVALSIPKDTRPVLCTRVVEPMRTRVAVFLQIWTPSSKEWFQHFMNSMNIIKRTWNPATEESKATKKDLYGQHQNLAENVLFRRWLWLFFLFDLFQSRGNVWESLLIIFGILHGLWKLIWSPNKLEIGQRYLSSQTSFLIWVWLCVLGNIFKISVFIYLFAGKFVLGRLIF